MSAIYQKFSRVIGRLRRNEQIEWKMRMARIKAQQALLSEGGAVMGKRNKHYYKQIMNLIDEEKSMRREHTEEMVRLRHEEELLLNSAKRMEMKNQDQEKILKIKILEYDNLEKKVLANSTAEEKARREEL